MKTLKRRPYSDGEGSKMCGGLYPEYIGFVDMDFQCMNVVESCETCDQLDVAVRYVEQAKKRGMLWCHDMVAMSITEKRRELRGLK